MRVLTRFTPLIVAIIIALLAGLSALHAQDRGGPREVRGATPGAFDLYVLALSWSSGFCAVEGDRRDRDQCRDGAGLDFVVHGLWPQFEQGYPVECGGDRTPSRIALDAARGVFPEEGLARHQWRKHGTCSGLSPQAYFQSVREARDRVVIPEMFRKLENRTSMTPQDVERAFVAANPGLRADMLAVACRQNMLNEVRICMSKDLRAFRPCLEVDRKGCRAREISVPGIR
jgi:ribonuclease T2